MARNEFLRLQRLAARPKMERLACERVLAGALREVMTELFFTNAGLLMAYIHAGQTNIIDDIVASCAERSLKPGALRYGGQAMIQADWGVAPTVVMDMELGCADCSLYFRIIFDAGTVGVEMDSILYHGDEPAPDALLDHLTATLEGVRLSA